MIRRLSILLAATLAAVSGVLFSWAFPGANMWWLSLVAPMLVMWALLGRGVWSALLIGLIFGSTFWLSLINWLTLYLGPVPWLALGLLQAIFYAIACACMALILNCLGSVEGHTRSQRTLRLIVTPVLVGSVWSAKEVLTSLWPYGGFSWGKVAQAQADSPFAKDIGWLATSGLSFVLVVSSALVFQLLREKSFSWEWLVPASLIFVLAVVPAVPRQTSGTTSVLAVQGNSRAGIFDTRVPGEILQDHLRETLHAKEQDIGNVDVIVWPENSADVDPLRNGFARAQIDAVSATFNAPIIVGTITKDAQGRYFNSSLTIDDKTGVIGQYDKVHPVPFAEYIPDREIWHFFAPELIDLVQLSYSFGTRSSVEDINGVPTGIQICFDVTDDVLARELIHDGGEYIVLQTNNADFGKTVESAQQLAITKLRAIETGRSIVSVSTVGASEIYDASGQSLAQIPAHQAGYMRADVPLSRTITPAIFFGPAIDTAVIALALSGLLLVVIRRKF